MEYNELSKEELIKKLTELELLNAELLNEKNYETGLDYPWTGNLGHWYWNIQTNTVNFNILKATALGYEESELPEHVTYQFFTEKLHPNDYQKTMDAMLMHLQGKAPVYEVEYRIQTKDGNYKWYYDRGKITQYDQNGEPVFLAGIVFDITKNKEQQFELEQKNQILEEMASLDGLTKISNHKTIMEFLDNQIMKTGKTGEDLSVIMFDVDDFKRVNDTKGHVLGDCILHEIADLIKNNIRKTDMVGRYGGEEFLIVLPGTNEEVARTIGNKIRKIILDYGFPCGMKITLSGGVKTYQGEQGLAFIDAVDKNLYQAKNNGKNQIV